MIFIVVKFTARPEVRDEWMNAVADFTSATRAEPGNLWFEWSRSVEDENEFVLLEAFRDANAGAAHVNSAHFRSAMETIPALLQKVPDIVNVELPGAGWSKLDEMQAPPA